MKRKIILSIAIVVSLTIILLTSSDSRVEAQNQVRIIADTGVITLGPNQILRVTVVGALDLNDLYYFRINKQSYAQNACSDGICKLAVASQTSTNPIMLMPGEAASIDIVVPEGQQGVRGVVLSNSRDIRVNAYIINAVTGAFEMNVLRD